VQRVRLDTAYGYILLSDAAARNDGLSVLDLAAQVARQYGLSYQLRSIEGIREGQLESVGVPVPEHEQREITDEQFHDAALIWDYCPMGHEHRPCSAAIGLGSHDLGVATTATDPYRAGLPVVVFSGATAPSLALASRVARVSTTASTP
jgi:hypothetical protein